MNYKRKKPRRSVKCFMCTQYRWMGNAKGRKRISDLRNQAKADAQS